MTASLGSEQLQKRLQRALDLSGNTHTIEDIQQAVARGQMQCFVDGDSFIITEIMQYPRKRILNVFLIVGDISVIDLFPKIGDFAREAGCEYMQGFGRDGWKRVLPKRGWKQSLTMFTYDLRQSNG